MFLKIEPEFSNFLRILGFQELLRYPKMKDVVKMFRKTALKKHPDKPGGNTQEFQELQVAFKKAGQYLENSKPTKVVEKDDVEECAARKLFKEFYVNGETYQSDFLDIFNEQFSIEEIAAEIIPEAKHTKEIGFSPHDVQSGLPLSYGRRRRKR